MSVLYVKETYCFEHALYILPRTNTLACHDLALDSTQRMFDPVFMLVLSPALSRNLKNRQVDHIKELHNIVTMTVCGLYYSEFWIWNFVFRHIYANCGLFVTSQLYAVEETGVPGENHRLTPSHCYYSEFLHVAI